MSPKTTPPSYASAAGARGRAIPAWATMPFFAVALIDGDGHLQIAAGLPLHGTARLHRASQRQAR